MPAGSARLRRSMSADRNTPLGCLPVPRQVERALVQLADGHGGAERGQVDGSLRTIHPVALPDGMRYDLVWSSAKMSGERASNPVLDATVERALAPFRGLLPPEVLEEFRDTMADALTEHPVSKELLNRLRERRVPDESGDEPALGASAAEGAPNQGGKAG